VEKTRFLVVGAGVTGLGFVDWLDSDDVLICEADPEVGGYCKTVVQDGFVWDYSGHFFHFKHPEIERYLTDRMDGQRVHTIRKASFIQYGGRLIDFPFQKNIHQLPQDELIECLFDLFFRPAGTPANFKEMLVMKFGRGIAEKFLVPYNEKLYATDLARLDVDAMGRFFPHADIADIIRNFKAPDNATYNATFTYPEGGAIQYIRALERDIPRARLALGEPVVGIDLERKVARTTKREIAFEVMVSSVPFPRVLAMTGLPHDPAVYTWNQVLVFNLGFDRKGWKDIHWCYFPDPNVSFYRVGWYDNIFDTDRMSLYVEIGRPHGVAVDTDGALARVLEDLERTGVTSGHRLVSRHQVVLDPAYVHITRASMADVAEKKRLLAAHGVHAIGRYGSWTYCSIEDNLVEARALAEVFNAQQS
jgi:protoporphyrinogen oxidase